MALVLANRVQQTGTANTTVSFTLTGSVTGYQSFAVIGNTNTTYYSATDTSGNWEVGLGTYSTTGPTLTRTTIYASSNAGAAVTFSGTVTVFVTLPSGSAIYEDASGNASALGTITSATWNASTIGVAYGGTGVTTSSGANSVMLRDANQNVSVNRLNQADTATTAAAGTTVLSAASTYSQTLNGTGGQTYQMPDATTLNTGVAFIFNNNATGTLTLVNNASGAIGTIAPGGAAEIVLLANGTVGGTWDVHAFIPENVTWGTNALALGSTVITGGTWNGGTITSGYGGTGLTTFTGANNALYSTSASALAAGTLPVAAGGTGLTSGTSGGVPYYSAAGTLASSAALAANALVIGGGAGVAPSTTTTAAGILTFLGSPSSANLAAALTNETGSGQVVFNTSPTLTTPTLNTPSLSAETFSTSAAVSAAGTVQGTATALTSDYNVVTTAAANSGVALPTATVGRRIIVVNKGANALNVYPATGGAIDALATNAAISLPVNGYMEFNASSTTQWYSTSNISAAGGAVTSFSAGTTGLTPSTATTGAVTLAGTLAVANGGTGLTSTPANGALDIGNGTGFTRTTLSAGTGISITNGAGSINIASSVTPVTSVTGTSPVVSSGGTTPALSLASGYGDTQNPYASKTANFFLAAPNGIAGVPTFRAVVAADIPTLNQNTTGSAGSVSNALTINNGGAGAASGTTYNGSSAVTVSYNTVGAPSTTGTGASGTWSINVTGSAGSSTTSTTATNVAGGALGSLPYQSAASTTALLAGNTTATKQFLVQTGTGTVSAAPAWGSIAAADVPTLNQNTTGTAANITATSNTTLTSLANLATVGTIGTGTWQGSIINSTYGGTGVNNAGRTFTVNTNSGTISYTLAATTLTVANNASVSGTNTGDQTITLTGDVTGSGTGSFATTLATVNANVGSFGSGSLVPVITVNAKGLITAVSTAAVSATNATNATNTGTTDDTSTNATMYPVWKTAATGNLPEYVSSTKLTFNPSTGNYIAPQLGASNGIIVNATTVATNYTIPTNYNAMSAGPVTVNTGISVTVPTGSVWTVV